ncbi:TspO/MBR family protein [Mycolicibacterium psychrotolerans]|uniref:TspO/MBR family protein n=1 Tax=Mycolicibacterium psychrotolerans TaxID=216929 RepID=UPI003D67303E
MGKSIVATSLATAAAAVTGSIASRSGVETWYPHIRKPRYVPPNAVFPVAWTTLYADIAVTSAATIDKLRANGEEAKARSYIGALGVNLVLNAGWSWLFFKSHKLGPSAVAAGALAVSSADLARRSAAADPKFAAALAPYPLWCSFATLMSTDIWRLNR